MSYEMAKELAGNWLKFDSFSYWGRPDEVAECPKDWALVYIDNRDSRLLEECNAEAIREAMTPYLDDEKWGVCLFTHEANHWAVGWVGGYCIRVYEPLVECGGGCTPTRNRDRGHEDRTLTPVFLKWCELQEQLEDYPVLDEEACSSAEYEATLENIKDVGRRFVADDAPDDWVSQCWRWFWDNDQGAIENVDDQGGYPSDDEMRDCLLALHMLDHWHMDEEELERERLWQEFKDAPGQLLLPFAQEAQDAQDV